MIKKLRLLFSGAVTFGVLFGVVLSGVANAATFNQNSIISDAVFDNVNTMTAAQIDAFLNTFPSSCISTNHGFSAPDPTGYNLAQGFLYGSFVSAGQVIYDAAQAYGLNPQVILATLQKEQSLVDGGAGCSTLRYTAAVGYGCPDGGTSYNWSSVNLYAINGTPVTSVTGTCVNTSIKSGFTQQIIRAAWVFKFAEQRSEGNIGWAVIKGAWDNSDDLTSNYSGYMTQGTWATGPSSGSAYYDGYATIDGTAVHMDNGATAALYRYTPHFAGNQSFLNIFTSWFVPYSWSVVSQSYTLPGGTEQSYAGGIPVDPGDTVTLKMVVLNTGSATWSNGGANPVRLATWQPSYRTSTFQTSSWISSTRVTGLQEASVAPGQTGTFIFTARATRPGNYPEYFNMVAEGASWFTDPGATARFNFNVRGNYQWQLVSQTYGSPAQPYQGGIPANIGDTVPVTITLANTGDTTWHSNGDYPVTLSTWLPPYHISKVYSPDWLSQYRPVQLHEASVAPGSNGTFTFNIVASSLGNYGEYFNLVAEGQTWFPANQILRYNFNVNSTATWKMISQSSSTGSFVLPHGSTATFTLVAQNTGNVTWGSTTYPVRLATWAPSYRTSIFNPNDGSWPSQFRAAALDPSKPTVAPLDTGIFKFNVKAPQTPGFYVERFNLVMEGATWFQDPWVEFDIVVT